MAWTLQFPRAEFRSSSEAIDVHLEMPTRWTVWDAKARGPKTVADAALFDLEIFPSEAQVPLNIDPPTCADAYIRESDLIAMFPQAYPWPFGYQIDFRHRSDAPGKLRAMEIWLSVSTSMLECNPRLHLVPSTPLVRRLAEAIAVAEHGRAALLVHPLDMADCAWVPSATSSAVGQWDVFGGFMEKGVIRRARFLCAWSDATVPADAWAQLLEWFSRMPLPLTA